MKILSLNIWGGMLHAPLLDYLAEVDADVYCLQEVARAPKARSEWLTYRDHGVELQQRANLFEEIKAVLPEHDAFFCPTARGELIDGDRPCWQEFGLATFVRNTFPLIGQAQDFVHGSFSPHGFGPHPRARNAHCIRLFDYGRDRPITIAHLHGLRALAGKDDTPEREAQAHALVALIERLHPPAEALVVCGDFNVLPGSRTFEILATLRLTDLVTTRGFSDTRTSHYRKPGRFADYMLATPDIPVATFDVVASPEVSDHRPLLLSIG
ncbi:endonuclease/exonuclease/phosphatase family protein [Rhizobiaceae bacterium n13]|uniref:Endonuclease/exonuclease/phosphatase family protein n=1 Tax=Ferirhizobium litorale TaxID=2927786 RepID=A0AAE3QIV8_9HYPH|nr:endonuclease/exonuclease/phosphatase family protein [Fererhizobium litorale]MDI7863937.1 endonuclease/exonuclease/phosphatase family protein [Fererhizobium litorale]MDI7924231.1 endonuclease/exonuclease/phosphatase family protein [Fererhizobium litorale]